MPKWGFFGRSRSLTCVSIQTLALKITATHLENSDNVGNLKLSFISSGFQNEATQANDSLEEVILRFDE